jgi:hypothetical protein
MFMPETGTGPKTSRAARRRPVAENAGAPTSPDVTTIPESKVQLTIGITLGLGIALVLAGFLGWFSISYTYDALKRFFLFSGYDPNSYYLFRDLTDLIATYLTLMVTGAVALLFGALALKIRAVKELFSIRGPHSSLAGGLMGGGGALVFSSTRFLFVYILASDYLQLELFIASFLIGAFLVACGILALKSR